MSGSYFPYGIGGQTGNILATCRPIIVTGRVYYVSSVDGDDVTNDGLDRCRPKATLTAAYAAASSWDVIVLFSNHSETLAANLEAIKMITIVGEGNNSGYPTAYIDCGAYSIRSYSGGTCSSYIDVRNVDVVCTGIAFDMQSTAGVPLYRFDGCRITATGVAAEGVYVTGNAYLEVNNTTIIAGTSSNYGIHGDNALNGTLTIRADSTVVDGGVGSGFAGGGIYLADGGGTGFLHAFMERITLLNGADVFMSTTGVGYINPEESRSSAVLTFG